ncbi:methionine sulfoxide reductase B [Suhomyces tanzawaensis NRRL Y-17324]|uniref:Peptide-methionine (R)-S-oxide reductase n=1 Tax=Suhomyces tanzawaensis NRRL Y-17324 TaxID=984487 RepID=A0A1E4SEE7_9ASCO|nr:methionine sulfoxide reductase B [Suhomyces tanzawaensis NRRL Y-17324]ODV77885.1 methionine sulfoxide reductase B [Suhomyces tanzawaensis NRRL Y-17324]
MSTIPKSEEEWRAVLSPQQFKVLRKQGTEAPYTGEYTSTPATETGHYACAGCNQPLYKSLTKFIAHCGWPAFYQALPGAITINRETSFGMVREEMRCSNCDGHLGHIFRGEGYKNPTDERHCVNSVSIKFDKEDP